MSKKQGIKISYWDCKFAEYNEEYDEDTGEELRMYGCTSEKRKEGVNEYGSCDLDNKYYKKKRCPFAKKET